MKYLLYLCVGLVVSFYYFSFGFTFLPEFVNTKMMLAVLGLPLAAIHIIKDRSLSIDRGLLIAVLIAFLFSIVGYISVDINNTTDYTYANYFISFFVWLFSAYTVCLFIKSVHGKIDLEILCYYLTAVCVAQCFLALYIDSSIIFRSYVDAHISQDQEFLTRVNRLYGIGASLDNAGVRFSIVLILIAAVLSTSEEVYGSIKIVFLLCVGYFIIVGVGNMISRTTILGTALGLVVLFWNLWFSKPRIDKGRKKIYFGFLSVLAIGIILSIWFYQTDEVYRGHLRFAFEGFFNWIEKGKWYTDSTDRLNQKMWIWPDYQDSKTWIIGTGLFDGWAHNTDIGYCRFVWYNGLVGLSVFLIFFIYLPISFFQKLPIYWVLFLALFALTLLVWVKVSTDIFLIYSLLFGLTFTNVDIKKNRIENNL